MKKKEKNSLNAFKIPILKTLILAGLFCKFFACFTYKINK